MSDEAKRAAARAAVRELPAEGVIGLGTGSTAKFFIEEVGALVRAGRKYQGVATSEASRVYAIALGIPLLPDDGPWSIAVTVDGADEVDPALNLIKGGGGAHLREKIVNYASARNVIIVDESKTSPQLGTKRAIPVEVLPFAHATTARHLSSVGEVTLRMNGLAPLRTDANNLIYDVRPRSLANPFACDRFLRSIPGVMETGLFLGRADVVLIATRAGVERRTKPLP
ncbi:MAG: ribose-5-phosphate isomerase RpiA [Polyangiales bacterium]